MAYEEDAEVTPLDANLYFAGPGCDPVPDSPEDYYSRDKTQSMSGLGQIPQYSFGIEDVFKDGLWPAKEISKTNKTVNAIDCIRTQTDGVINRHLDFRYPRPGRFLHDKGHQKQIALYKWMCKNFERIEVGSCLWLVFIPMKIEASKVFYDVSIPVKGIEYSILEKFTNTEIITGLDGGDPETCGMIEIPEDLQFSPDCNRVFGIRIDALPEPQEDPCKEEGKGKLDGWAVQTSVKFCCPFQGY